MPRLRASSLLIAALPTTRSAISSLDGSHDSEQWVPVHVFQWKIDEMSFRIDRNRVSVRHVELAELTNIVVAFFENGDGAGFRRYVEASEPRIECQHIRIFAHLVNGEELHRIQVKDCEGVILLAGDESEPMRLIECDAMRVFYVREFVSADDLHRCGVNRDQLVDTVHSYKDVA